MVGSGQGDSLRKFAIAGLQLELSKGDNVDRLCAEIRIAKKRFPWLDMVVLGELNAYGTPLENAEPLGGRAERAFARVAQETGLWLIPGSLYEWRDDKIFNMSPVINPAGEIIARYRKIFPFLPYEQDVAAGDKLVTFDVPNVGRFGVIICYDIWFPETVRSLAWLGAEAIICPTLTNTIDRDVELAMARSNAAMNQCYVFNVNACGPLAFGRSIVCGPGGEVIHQATTAQEIFPVELDFDYVGRVRERGWQGLGQVLKSFRQNTMQFPAYVVGTSSSALDALGPLKLPDGHVASNGKSSTGASTATHLKVAKT